MSRPSSRKGVLCFSGLDPSGGAGLLLDVRVCQVLGLHPVGAATALTVQNTQGVLKWELVDPSLLRLQLTNLLSDVAVHAIKVGMLGDNETVQVVAEAADEARTPVVVDPVLDPKSGPPLVRSSGLQALKNSLLPRATIVTPNVAEAEALSGMERIRSAQDLSEAAKRISQRYGCAVLAKGGHLPGAHSVDVLAQGEYTDHFEAKRLEHGSRVHGTGCLLSTSLACFLALGFDIPRAVSLAKRTLTTALRHTVPVGKGSLVFALSDFPRTFLEAQQNPPG